MDLKSYAAWKQEDTERVATAAVAAGGASRISFTRRPVLELPLAVAPPPVPLDSGRDGIEPVETTSPGAEFEPVSPLDVPAFLRRQNE